MCDYQIVIEILSNVLMGKNLNEAFNHSIAKSTEQINIAKIKDISYGVLRYYFVIDEILNKLIEKKPKDKIVYIILLIALYEIKYTKKPRYAITNDLVELSQILTKNKQIKNFVNAVIRNYLRIGPEIEKSLKDKPEFKYNFPLWWIKKLKQDFPLNYVDMLNNLNQIPKINLRINLSKIAVDDYTKELEKSNIEFMLIDNKISLTESISVDKIPFFAKGYVSIQDIHAQKLIDLIKPNKNDYILDACVAPGGKMCQILESCTVEMIGLDIDQSRLDKVQQNLDRLGLKAKLLNADASKLDWWDDKMFDLIIADVPCSASGTVKRNPDIKLHRQLFDIANFVLTQRRIIINLWQILKPGGRMVYITCSIFREENEDNIKFFSQNLSKIKVIQELKFLPTKYADGFYYCILQKQ